MYGPGGKGCAYKINLTTSYSGGEHAEKQENQCVFLAEESVQSEGQHTHTHTHTHIHTHIL